MVDVGQVIYYRDAAHLAAGGQTFVSNTMPKITHVFPQKTVKHKNDKVGISTDPNRVYRVITMGGNWTGAVYDAFGKDAATSHLMPDTAPTYDATYPKIALKINGAITWTIQCMISAFEAAPAGNDLWAITVTFTERSL